jgi:catechol 2,3-dioxygenase-like lactoylglutathione lyase family enzyme
MPTLTSLDHLVLTVRDLETTIAFYTDVLNMVVERFRPADGTERWALTFGHQKINLHELGSEFEPNAAFATAGSADLCFLTQTPLSDWQAHLKSKDVHVEEGPVPRTGATGPILSIYIRDPDRNLIEISTPAP